MGINILLICMYLLLNTSLKSFFAHLLLLVFTTSMPNLILNLNTLSPHCSNFFFFTSR